MPCALDYHSDRDPIDVEQVSPDLVVVRRGASSPSGGRGRDLFVASFQVLCDN